MRPRIDGSSELEGPVGWGRRSTPATGETLIIRDLFINSFQHHLARFFPKAVVIPLDDDKPPVTVMPRAFSSLFDLDPDSGQSGDEVRIFGRRFRISRADGSRFNDLERSLVAAIGRVMNVQYSGLFRMLDPDRLALYQGSGEDHFVAAFIEPRKYTVSGPGLSRIASTIQALRIAALSTYENRRVSTGALLLGEEADTTSLPPTPPDALPYNVELTGLKSLHRLCDGVRTLFQVDCAGMLRGVVDIARFAASVPGANGVEAPLCARIFQAHGQATQKGGHICLVLSPNQEIKLFAQGAQVFSYAHGRWRLLDVEGKYATWEKAVQAPRLARTIFQAALNLAESRHGALFVIVDDPRAACERLLAPHDVLAAGPTTEPPPEALAPRDPLAKRALHYLARDRHLADLDLSVLEALASLDGAVVADRSGRILGFGAILRQETSDLPHLTCAEGARTTAAMAASRFGPVLKVSEDGLVSCFLDGHRAWDV